MSLIRIVGTLGMAALAVGPVWAQDTPSPDFTFKFVKPPKPGAAKRITIQIAPPVVAAPAAVTPPAAQPPKDMQDWFWDQVSPALEPPEDGRFTRAVALAKSSEAVRAPSLQIMRDIAQTQGPHLLRHSVGTKVSPALALAVVAVESAGKPQAVSRAGAQGLMQLIPATAERFGVTDAFDADQNIKAGITYLDWLMAEFYGDPLLALAGYNAGEGAVKKYGGVPPFAETRAYVPRVLAAWQVARLLCITPPELPSDGCVFASTPK